ncbi:Verruculogen synthase [Elasticomyces elasticus]|nr:Verruculogen synthase [Elasticomyces elasticus]
MGLATTEPALREVAVSEGADRILAVYREDGGVVIKKFFSQQQVGQINKELDDAIAGISTGAIHQDKIRRDFHGTNTKRLVGLVNHSPTYAAALDADIVHEISDIVFKAESGDWWMNTSMCQATLFRTLLTSTPIDISIEIGPGNRAQALHRDQYQYPIFTHVGSDAPEAHINFFIAMTDFTDENGATRVIPGSHLWPDFSNNGVPEDTIPAEMQAGDCFLFSGKVVHGGGANRTTDFYRRAISLSIQASYLVPEEASVFMVPMDRVRKLSARVQKMLGFGGNRDGDETSLWKVNFESAGKALGLQ